jgi:hypothetical protein
MDAIVTIQVLDGKKPVGTIERAVEIHPDVAANINKNPAACANWILSEARNQSTFENSIIKKAANGAKESK